MSEEKKYKDIELRSEKVRNIVGKVPPRLLRIGISIISAVILLVLLLAYTIPYPQYYTTDITIAAKPYIDKIRAPISGIYYRNTEDSSLGIIISTDSVISIRSRTKDLVINDLDSTPVNKNDIIAITSNNLYSLWGKCKIPIEEIKNINIGQKVNILISSSESCTTGTIDEIGKILQSDSISNKSYYNVTVKLETNIEAEKLVNSKFKAQMLLSDEPILKRIFYKQ
ncbi:MAG: hypothetical protein ACK5LL_06550 [Suipraeoptans sp.]